MCVRLGQCLSVSSNMHGINKLTSNFEINKIKRPLQTPVSLLVIVCTSSKLFDVTSNYFACFFTKYVFNGFAKWKSLT